MKVEDFQNAPRKDVDQAFFNRWRSVVNPYAAELSRFHAVPRYPRETDFRPWN